MPPAMTDLGCRALVGAEQDYPGIFYVIGLVALIIAIREVAAKISEPKAAPSPGGLGADIKKLTDRVPKVLRVMAKTAGVLVAGFSAFLAATKLLAGDVFVRGCYGRCEYSATIEKLAAPDPPSYDPCHKVVSEVSFERDLYLPSIRAVRLPNNFKELAFSASCDVDRPQADVAVLPGASLDIYPTRDTAEPPESTVPETVPSDCKSGVHVEGLSTQPREFGLGSRIVAIYRVTNPLVLSACDDGCEDVPFEVPGVWEMHYQLPRGFFFRARLALPVKGTCDGATESWLDRGGVQRAAGPTVWVRRASDEGQGCGRQPFHEAMGNHSVAYSLKWNVSSQGCVWHVGTERPAEEDLSVSITFRLASSAFPVPKGALPRCSTRSNVICQ